MQHYGDADMVLANLFDTTTFQTHNMHDNTPVVLEHRVMLEGIPGGTTMGVLLRKQGRDYNLSYMGTAFTLRVMPSNSGHNIDEAGHGRVPSSWCVRHAISRDDTLPCRGDGNGPLSDPVSWHHRAMSTGQSLQQPPRWTWADCNVIT